MDAKTLARKAAWRKANREKIREADRLLYQKRKEKVLVHKKLRYQEKVSLKPRKTKPSKEEVRLRNNAYQREYRKNNKEMSLQRYNRWHSKNPNKTSEYSTRYRLKNLKKHNANTRKYKLAKTKRVPKWAEIEEIRNFYENCPKGYHVDHIIPLRGKNISGLHVLSNLQYLTIKENLQKTNKF